LDQFWRLLEEKQPRLAQGFVPVRTPMQNGIRIVDLGRRWKVTDYAPFNRSLQATAAALRAPVTIQWKRMSVSDYCNPWPLAEDGQRYLSRIKGENANHTREAHRQQRPQAERWIKEALAREPGQIDQQLPKPLRRGMGARIQYH